MMHVGEVSSVLLWSSLGEEAESSLLFCSVLLWSSRGEQAELTNALVSYLYSLVLLLLCRMLEDLVSSPA